jgi:hypothetical protein
MAQVRLGASVSDRLLFCDGFRFSLELKAVQTALLGGLGVFTSVNKSAALQVKSTPPTASGG